MENDAKKLLFEVEGGNLDKNTTKGLVTKLQLDLTKTEDDVEFVMKKVPLLNILKIVDLESVLMKCLNVEIDKSKRRATVADISEIGYQVFNVPILDDEEIGLKCLRYWSKI